MDGLRWLLLGLGVLVIAGVYFYSRRESNKKDEPETYERNKYCYFLKIHRAKLSSWQIFMILVKNVLTVFCLILTSNN